MFSLLNLMAVFPDFNIAMQNFLKFLSSENPSGRPQLKVRLNIVNELTNFFSHLSPTWTSLIILDLCSLLSERQHFV